MRSIEIGYTRAIAMRVNYVGELGWELHLPWPNICSSVYDLLFGGGCVTLGIADYGLYAMDCLRLEKCYRSWKADLTTEYTPFMSLARPLRQARQAGRIHWPGGVAPRSQRAGPRERFVPLIVDAGDADAAAVSIVFHGKEDGSAW